MEKLTPARATTPIAQRGLTLLVLLVLLALGGFALAQVSNAGHVQEQLKLQQQARQAGVLDHIRSGLLGFAANQGVHSQSHLGHLPCPANVAGSYPATTCLSKPWGYLPVNSKIAVNYLNQGIDARNNELEPSARHHWQYAVSAQLIQPNALGWSRWVDFSQPGIQITVPLEDNRVETQIAAVVAHSIEPLGPHAYRVTPPYLLIRTNELLGHMRVIQTQLLQNTLRTWHELQTAGNTPGNIALLDNENFQSSNSLPNSHFPIDSQCSCRCTKTRCVCNCAAPGEWASSAQCTGENCDAHQTGSLCSSTGEQSCTFSGPAGLRSNWPVSRFEPVAAINKSCRPNLRNQCPLSTSNQPCICDFSWPDNTRNSLSNFAIQRTQTGALEVRAIKP